MNIEFKLEKKLNLEKLKFLILIENIFLNLLPTLNNQSKQLFEYGNINLRFTFDRDNRIIIHLDKIGLDY